MTTALLSWLSKSSSASLHRQIHHLYRCRCYHLSHRCHPRRHLAGRRHHLLGKILRKNSVSTSHKYWMLLTNYNYQPHSFHFPRRSFGRGIKPAWSSRGYNTGKVGSTVHTWLHYDASKDLLLSLHEGGKEEHFDYQ